jgi:hypothetical protein
MNKYELWVKINEVFRQQEDVLAFLAEKAGCFQSVHFREFGEPDPFEGIDQQICQTKLEILSLRLAMSKEHKLLWVGEIYSRGWRSPNHEKRIQHRATEVVKAAIRNATKGYGEGRELTKSKVATILRIEEKTRESALRKINKIIELEKFLLGLEKEKRSLLKQTTKLPKEAYRKLLDFLDVYDWWKNFFLSNPAKKLKKDQSFSLSYLDPANCETLRRYAEEGREWAQFLTCSHYDCVEESLWVQGGKLEKTPEEKEIFDLVKKKVQKEIKAELKAFKRIYPVLFKKEC